MFLAVAQWVLGIQKCITHVETFLCHLEHALLPWLWMGGQHGIVTWMCCMRTLVSNVVIIAGSDDTGPLEETIGRCPEKTYNRHPLSGRWPPLGRATACDLVRHALTIRILYMIAMVLENCSRRAIRVEEVDISLAETFEDKLLPSQKQVLPGGTSKACHIPRAFTVLHKGCGLFLHQQNRIEICMSPTWAVSVKAEDSVINSNSVYLLLLVKHYLI